MTVLQRVKEYESLIQEVHRAIKCMKAYPSILTEPEHKYLHAIFDKVLFNALCGLDLITELKYLDVSIAVGNSFEATFFARITAHSCFEILDNMNWIVGKEIMELVKVRLEPQALSDLKSHIKDLNEVKKRHLKELKRIRNELFGHRMKVGHDQAERMLGITPQSIYGVGHRIFEIETNILSAFGKILERI